MQIVGRSTNQVFDSISNIYDNGEGFVNEQNTVLFFSGDEFEKENEKATTQREVISLSGLSSLQFRNTLVSHIEQMH